MPYFPLPFLSYYFSSFRVALIRRLAGTKWGASFGVLRTSVPALPYSPMEYCAPAWTQSAHAQRAWSIDHLLDEILHVKDALSCLPSRRPLQQFV